MISTTTAPHRCTCEAGSIFSHAEQTKESRRFASGEVVWNSANADGKLVLVKEGLLRVYNGPGEGKMRLVHLIGPGTWMGMESLAEMPGQTRVVAAGPVTVAFADARSVLDDLATDPQRAAALLRHLARQVAQLQQELTESRYAGCVEQIARALLRLAHCGGALARNGNTVTLQVTQQDVADAVGIARETVNAMLNKLSQQKLITKQRGRITFDEAALQAWVARSEQNSRPAAVPA